MKKLLTFATFLTLLSACSGNFYQIPTPAYDPKEYETIATDSKTGSGVMLFQIIPIGQNSKIEKAVEFLKKKYNADAITNISVQERWYWAYVLNIYKTEVSGTLLKKKVIEPKVKK